jgi:hypothetical protein
MLTRRVPLLVPTLSLALFACRPPSSELPIEELRGDAGQDSQTSHGQQAGERLDPLPVQVAADMLPADVVVMAEALDPSAVLAQINKLDKYPEFQGFRAQLSSQVGIDPLDAGQWERIGLDRHRGVGIGLLDIESEGFFLYAGVSDQRALETFMEDLVTRLGMQDQLGTAEIDRARVYRFGEELSVILREGWVVAVMVDRPERATRDYAAMVATIDPREALSRTQGFAWAKQRLEPADDGMLFVDPRRLIAQLQTQDSENQDYGVRYAEDELARARAAGEPRQNIEAAEQRVEEERRWQQERQVREAGRRELVRALFDPVGAFVGALELRDDGITGHAHTLIPGDGLLARLFVASDSESPLLRALDEPPMMAVDGRLDIPALLMFAELVAKTEGQSLQAANDEVQSMLGVDLLGELIPALTGAGGVWITSRREPDPNRLSEAEKSLGLAVHVELAKPDVIRKLIDGLARSARVPGLTPAKRGDGWLLALPEWNDVNIDVVGNRLIASTDAKLAGRIRDAKPGTQAKPLAEVNHPLHVGSPTASLRMYQRWRWLVILDARDPWKQDAESMLYDINLHPELTPEEAAAVPRSREFKRKLAALEKAVDALDEHQRREAGREFTRTLELVDQFGDAGLALTRTSDGVEARATWRMASGVTPIDTFVPLLMRSDQTDWSEYERLNQEVMRTRDEAMAVRRADLDAAAAAKRRTVSPP